MKTYTAYFYSDANYAYEEIDAETPEDALAKASRMNEDDEITYFEFYDQAPRSTTSRFWTKTAMSWRIGAMPT
jgi:hypothetical protein